MICSGERTFGVLTKLDLMDKGTNALEVCSFQTLSINLSFANLCLIVEMKVRLKSDSAYILAL